MSNRSSSHYNNNNNNRSFVKTHKKFVPKSSSSTPNSAEPHIRSKSSNPPATLSSSLRQSFHRKSDSVAATPENAAGTAASSGSSSNRARSVGNVALVAIPNRTQGGGNFVNYLPQDEAVASGLGADEGGLDAVESQRVVDLLNADLSRLLKLKPRDFWKEVATDVSLHDFLDSYLQFRSRWYDFPYHGAKGIVAGVIVGDYELSRRVFMVLYRISSHRDPGASIADSLSSKDHGILLQEKRFLDLPKLLDICAIYGHENEDLTRSLVLNALKAQPGLHNDFTAMMSHFLGVVYTMYQRCSSSLEAVISASGNEDLGASRRHVEYLEVMDFLNDAIVSLDAFVAAYKPAAVFFSCPVEMSHGSEELINILARLHDSLLPALQQGLQIILAAGGDGLQRSSSSMLSDLSISLKLLSTRIVDFGWKLLDCCYLSDGLFKDDLPLPGATKMFPANVEDPAIRGDILVQTFKEIAGVPQHAYGTNYKGTYLRNIDKNYQIMHRVQHLQSTGWIFIDDDQYRYLAGMMMPPVIANSKELGNAPASGKNDLQLDEDAAIMESKISQIRDLFPDYGKGFLSACLEVYNHNPEEVIQRILEGTLHEDLQAMDTSLEILPPKTLPSLSKKDKGKGKLLESPLLASNISSEDGMQRPQALSSSSSSSAGRFIRKSKVDEPGLQTLDSRDEKDTGRMAALLSQYEYEDEYDDSFDDLGISLVESGFEETEILGDRISSGMGISSGAERESSASHAARRDARKKPQFYVKDGKNYSYKVEGSVAVANYDEASLVNQAQKELIHGLGRGGNLPLGAVKKLEESNKEEGDQSDPSEGEGRGNVGGFQGRGRGRGRRGGGRNHHQRDRAMKKHMAGLGGF